MQLFVQTVMSHVVEQQANEYIYIAGEIVEV